VEDNETTLEALRRELREELGIRVVAATLYRVIAHVIGQQSYVGYYYNVDEYDGEVVNAESDKAEQLFYASRNHALSLTRKQGPESLVIIDIESGKSPVGAQEFIGVADELEVYVYEQVNVDTPRKVRVGESCIALLRSGSITVCSACGAVVAEPMVHMEWHEEQEKRCVKK